MGFGVPHAEALLRNPIISIHPASQQRSISSPGHHYMLLSRSVTRATNTQNGWSRSDQMNRLLVIEQHGRMSPVLVVPHEDNDLTLGDGLLIVGCQHHLRPLAQFGAELLVGIRINLLALEVEQHDGSLLLESLIEHEDVRQGILGGFDQFVVATISAFLFGHRRLLSISSPGPWSSPPKLTGFELAQSAAG